MYGDVVLGVQKRAGRGPRAVRDGHRELKHERYHQDIEDTKLTVDDLQGAGRALQGARQGARRQGLPDDRRGTS